MITDKRIYRLIAVLISLSALALITLTAKNAVGINAITVALLYLLVVLAASAFAELACGFAVAVASGLLVNYYFLPPFGTFYIEAPEDWVSFFAYTATAVVVSHFAATVRRRAVEADRLQSQLSRLSRFTYAIMTVPEKDMTLEILTGELKRAYDLSYCAIYLFGKNGTASPVSSGSRPSSQSTQKEGMPSNLPNELLDVVAEEGPDVQCLSLKDRGETVGALVISQVPLSQEVSDAIADIVSLVVRQISPVRPVG
jgi:two-component system sensor histidine kinase KdpD